RRSERPPPRTGAGASMKRLMAISLLLAAGCGGSPASEPRPDGAPPPGGAAALEVVPVAAQKIDKAVHLPGELIAFESVALYPRVSAFVEDVLVDRGSRVRRGQLLVRLSAPELSAQRAEAQAK